MNDEKGRAQFLDVKRHLRSLQVSNSMLYTARLRIAALESTHLFENHKDQATY